MIFPKNILARSAGAPGFAAVALTGPATPVEAARIENPVAVFSGIDKITGRITTFDVYVGETVQFGALQVTPRVCYSRDETEAPKTTTFVEVDEITLDRSGVCSRAGCSLTLPGSTPSIMPSMTSGLRTASRNRMFLRHRPATDFFRS